MVPLAALLAQESQAVRSPIARDWELRVKETVALPPNGMGVAVGITVGVAVGIGVGVGVGVVTTVGVG